MIQLTNPLWAKLNTISASRMNKYFSCGFRYQCEYIWGMRPPAGISAARGKAVHKAIQIDNEYFIENRSWLGFNKLKEIAEGEFNSIVEKNDYFISRSLEDKQEKIIGKALHEVIETIRLYAHMEKDWEPVAVEENYTLDIGYQLPVVSYLDMVDVENCIYDWKTQSKTSIIHAGLQDMLYSKAYETKWGVKPRFKYVCFVIKKEPEIVIQELEPITDYSILNKYIEAYMNGIEHNVFIPSGPYNFLCSETQCSFYRACEYKHKDQK